MARKLLIDLDAGGVAKIINLATPTAAADAATKGYVDTLVEGLAWKASARVATSSNINLAAPGSSVDGVAMVSGDRILVKAQTAGAENGIYVWNGAATPASRSLDASIAAELINAVVTVSEGTSADTSWRQDVINITLGTTSLTWVAFGSSAGAASESSAGIVELATQGETDTGTDDLRAVTPLKLANHSNRKLKFSANVGDASATQFTVTHNLGTRDVLVQVVRVASPYDTVECDVERDTTNSVIVRFATAPTSNQYRVVILG